MKFTRIITPLGLTQFFALTTLVQAANVCVGPAATGDGSGRDWNNLKAWSSVPVRGDTWYLADGSYSAKKFSVAPSGTTPIKIKKATSSDPGTTAGWNSTFGDGQAVFNGMIEFTTSYYEFDGVTGGGPGKWNSGFGFRIVEKYDDNAIIRVGWSSTANNITIRHVDMEGKGSVSTRGGSYSNDGLAVYGDSNVTISYYWMHGVGRCPFYASPVNMLAEYGYVQSFFGSSTAHSEIASMWAFDGNVGDVTFRYNLFTDIESTGGIMWDNQSNRSCSLLIYGNVFYRPSNVTWQKANGVIGGWTAREMRNVKVYNNTFINVNQQSLSTFPNIASGCEAKNNLWFTCDAPNFTKFPTHNYNHFINSGGVQGETNGTTGSTDPFVNYAGLNFELKANTSPGQNLGAPFDVDATGQKRTTWTRGAYEFGSQTTTPTDPTSPTSPTDPTSPTSPTDPTSPTSPTTPVISATPSSVDFGSITAGTVANASVTVLNSGSGTLSGTASASAPFSVVSGGTFSLAAGQSQTVAVRYTPTAAGTHTGALTLTGGGGASVALKGTATTATTAPAVAVTPTSVAFGSVNVGANSDMPLSVRNSGTGTLSGTATVSAPFSIVSGGTYNLLAGQSQTVTVRYSPTSAGTNSGTVKFTGGNGASVAVSGSAVSSTPTGTQTVLQYGFDQASSTTVTDESGSNNNGSVLNGATVGAGKVGNGLAFDGVDDYVRVPSSASLESTTKALTISTWVKFEKNGIWQAVLRKVLQEGTHAYPYAAYDMILEEVNGVPKARLSVSRADGVRAVVYSSQALTYGQWVHLAGVYDGATLRVYVNGAQSGSTAFTGDIKSTGQALLIGRNGIGGDQLKGTIDDLRVYSKALTATEIQSLAAGGSTQAVLQYGFDQASSTTVTDESGSNNNGSVLNGATVGAGKVGNGLAFDGVDDYVRVPSSASLESTTKALTISTWVKFEKNGIWQAVLRKVLQEGTHAYPYAAYDMILEEVNGVPKARLSVSRADGVRAVVYSSQALTYGQWVHLAGVYDGATLRVYVNGAQSGSTAFTGDIKSTGQALLIGRNGIGGDQLKGTIDDLRVYSKALTATEIQSLVSGTSL